MAFTFFFRDAQTLDLLIEEALPAGRGQAFNAWSEGSFARSLNAKPASRFSSLEKCLGAGLKRRAAIAATYKPWMW